MADDQTGCIVGRSFFNNVRSTIDIMNYTNNMHGLLMYMDFDQAYRKLEICFSVFAGLTFCMHQQLIYVDKYGLLTPVGCHDNAKCRVILQALNEMSKIKL